LKIFKKISGSLNEIDFVKMFRSNTRPSIWSSFYQPPPWLNSTLSTAEGRFYSYRTAALSRAISKRGF